MFQKIIEFISFNIISPFNWTRIKFLLTGRAFDLTPEDREHARTLMEGGVYLWVSRRQTHLTSYLISFGDFALEVLLWFRCGCKTKRPRFGYWSHAFINANGDQLVEAVAKGVREVYFDEVFDCDSAAALVPAFITPNEWVEVSKLVRDQALKDIGKKYDAVFNIEDDSKVSCIELMRSALKKVVPDYDVKFRDFENIIKKYKNVTPQMLFDSKSFVVVWEVRR